MDIINTKDALKKNFPHSKCIRWFTLSYTAVTETCVYLFQVVYVRDKTKRCD